MRPLQIFEFDVKGLPRWKPFSLFRLGVPGGVSVIAAALLRLTVGSFGNEFAKPQNTVGDANCYGELQITSHLGAVELSRSEVFDFYYQFSSNPDIESIHLGKGFFVPLLEAILIDHDYFLEMTTLGGGTVYVYRLPGDPNQYVSLNGKQSVKKLGQDLFIRETEEGYKFEYRLGKLVRFQTPAGTRVELDYDGDFCRTVRSSTGATVCSMTKVNDSELVFSTARGRHVLKLKPHPLASGDGHQDSKTLASIEWPDGSLTRFTYPEAVDELGDSRILMRMSYNDQSMDCIWSRDSGRLLMSEGVEYSISPLSRNYDPEAERIVAGVYTIDRRFPDGSWKNFSHDEDNGVSNYEDSRGNSYRTHYIVNRGKTFNLVRKKERLPTDGMGKPETIYEAFYDTEAQLIRTIENGVVTWYLRRGGLPEDVVGQGDNYVKYDELGRPVLHSQKDFQSRTTWFADGSSRTVSQYVWGEVMLSYFDERGRPKPIPAGERFPEKELPLQ